MIIAENGESESYGVEDGGLFVEMVVTNEIDIRKTKCFSQVQDILYIYIKQTKTQE